MRRHTNCTYFRAFEHFLRGLSTLFSFPFPTELLSRVSLDYFRFSFCFYCILSLCRFCSRDISLDFSFRLSDERHRMCLFESNLHVHLPQSTFELNYRSATTSENVHREKRENRKSRLSDPNVVATRIQYERSASASKVSEQKNRNEALRTVGHKFSWQQK